MFSNDREKLEFLVQSYGLKEVIKVLADIAYSDANDAADMQLKDKTSRCISNATILDKLTNLISE